jgi:hypothetical protein
MPLETLYADSAADSLGGAEQYLESLALRK